jgi:hypothetical protein
VCYVLLLGGYALSEEGEKSDWKDKEVAKVRTGGMDRSETTVERIVKPKGSKGQGSSRGSYKGNHDTN